MHPVRKVINVIGAILGLYIVGSLIYFFGWGYFSRSDSEMMCSDISNLQTMDEIIQYAKDNDRPYFELPEKSKIIVLNHRPHFFRVACDVELENGILKSTNLRGAD